VVPFCSPSCHRMELSCHLIWALRNMSQSLVRPVFSISGKFVVSGSPCMWSQQQHSSMHLWLTCVDYCNAVLDESPKVTTDKLQRVMNSAARIVSNTRKFDSGLSRLLHDELHWLDVADQVQFKLTVLVYQCLHGTAPLYMTESCTNSWRHQSSTPVVRQSAENDHSAVLNEQLWPSVFCCFGPVDLEFAARQSSWLSSEC